MPRGSLAWLPAASVISAEGGDWARPSMTLFINAAGNWVVEVGEFHFSWITFTLATRT